VSDCPPGKLEEFLWKKSEFSEKMKMKTEMEIFGSY